MNGMQRIVPWLAALLFAGSSFGGEAAKVPQVDAQINPAGSFWLEHVQYPYPVHFAKVADGKGRQWELAYMDVFRGEADGKRKAPVLVLLHGRAMNSAYWGDLMEKPLAAGFRVVAVDWGHSGKSLARNLHMPVVRSLDDARQTVFNLVVKHLGIRKSSLLGHSLGGQVAAGYALRYPQHVERLVLYAPGGLGLQPPIEMKGVRLDDPDLVKQPEKFLEIWKSGILPSAGRTQDAVERSFYVPARPGAMPYLQRGDKLGEFIVASRAALLRANPKERERSDQGYAWDSLAALSECRAEDGDALPNRLPRIKVPTLVAMGMKESILSLDPLKPLHDDARRNQSPVFIKLYEKAGHFIHTDLAEQFSSDVLAFLKTGKATEPLFTGEMPKRAPLASSALPPEVLRVRQRFEAAWAKNDLKALREVYHPDFKEDGQTLQQRMDYIATFISMVSSWEMPIFAVTPTAEGFILDVEVRNNFGSFPMPLVMKRVGGELYYYGNQK